MFSGASNFVDNVDRTILFIFSVALFFLIGITVTMLYFVYKYNKKRRPKSAFIEGNIPLEIVWTVIPLILVAIMFYFGWSDFKELKKPPKDALTVTSTARMWSWSFKYPNGKVTDTLYVPVDEPVIVNLISTDVIHSMYIPAFRIKQDMVPGNDNFLWFIAQKEGKYNLFCAEYCGLQHAFMTTAVVSMPKPDFNKWYEDTTLVAAATGEDVKKALPGLTVLRNQGCIACHSLDGSKIVGPSFKNLYGHETTVIVDGKEELVTIDDDYIKESVYDPNAKIVKGYQKGLMQPYKGLITEEEIKQISEYLQSLE